MLLSMIGREYEITLAQATPDEKWLKMRAIQFARVLLLLLLTNHSDSL